MPVFVYKYVLRLNIPMDDSIPVHLFDCQYELSQVEPGMLLGQLTLWLLVDDAAHVASWIIVCDHIQVLKGLERIVQFGHEAVINLALDFFLRNHESRQAIVGTFLHALHRIEESRALAVRTQPLYEVDLSVGTAAQDTNALEIFCLHIEVAANRDCTS